MDITNSLTILLHAIDVEKLSAHQKMAYHEVKRALEAEQSKRKDPNNYVFYA